MDEFHVVCSLVRMYVLGRDEKLPDSVNWPEVFFLSAKNDVSDVCYEVVKRLPTDTRPDADLMRSWATSAKKKSVASADGFLEPDPVAQAVLIVDNAAKYVGVFSRKVPLRLMVDLALLLRRYPSVPDEWESGLRRAGLLHFGETMLCACDILLGTGFRRDWGWMTRLRAGSLLTR